MALWFGVVKLNNPETKTEIGRLFINSLSTTLKPCKCFNMNSRNCGHFFYPTSVNKCSVTYNLTLLMSKSTRIKMHLICGQLPKDPTNLQNLREYLITFQGVSLSNTLLDPTEFVKANTLAGVDSVRYQVAIFNFGLLPPDCPPYVTTSRITECI